MTHNVDRSRETMWRIIGVEASHVLLIFLMTIPFYLYGGNVLYGHDLLTNASEAMAFIVRVGVAVMMAEVLLNWMPYYGLGLTWWREKLLYIIFSGVLFGWLAYIVIPFPHYAGEATIGVSVIWVLAGIMLHLLYRLYNPNGGVQTEVRNMLVLEAVFFALGTVSLIFIRPLWVQVLAGLLLYGGIATLLIFYLAAVRSRSPTQ